MSIRRALLIEDSDDDVVLIRRAFRRRGVVGHLSTAASAEEGLAWLEDPAHHSQLAVVMVDIGLPGMTGLECVAAIRARPELSTVPVVVLTTSDDPHDVSQAYAAGCSSFVRKPEEPRAFVDRVGCLFHYWLEVNRMPGEALVMPLGR